MSPSRRYRSQLGVRHAFDLELIVAHTKISARFARRDYDVAEARAAPVSDARASGGVARGFAVPNSREERLQPCRDEFQMQGLQAAQREARRVRKVVEIRRGADLAQPCQQQLEADPSRRASGAPRQ